MKNKMILLSDKKVKLNIPANSNLNKKLIQKSSEKNLKTLTKLEDEKNSDRKSPFSSAQKFPIIKDSKIKNISNFDKTLTEDFNKIKAENENSIENYLFPEDNYKVDNDVIKKESYYSKLREIGETMYSSTLNKNFSKKNVDLKLKTTGKFMPVGLIKSPNSGEFCKFNLFDEYKQVKDDMNNKYKNDNNEGNKNIIKRKFSARTIEAKKNDPILKNKILRNFMNNLK